MLQAGLGVSFDSRFTGDIAAGVAVGGIIVTFTFLVELALGWLLYLQVSTDCIVYKF